MQRKPVPLGCMCVLELHTATPPTLHSLPATSLGEPHALAVSIGACARARTDHWFRSSRCVANVDGHSITAASFRTNTPTFATAYRDSNLSASKDQGVYTLLQRPSSHILHLHLLVSRVEAELFEIVGVRQVYDNSAVQTPRITFPSCLCTVAIVAVVCPVSGGTVFWHIFACLLLAALWHLQWH